MFPPILITADPSKHHEALMVKAVWNAQLFAVPEMREREREKKKYISTFEYHIEKGICLL